MLVMRSELSTIKSVWGWVRGEGAEEEAGQAGEREDGALPAHGNPTHVDLLVHKSQRIGRANVAVREGGAGIGRG